MQRVNGLYWFTNHCQKRHKLEQFFFCCSLSSNDAIRNLLYELKKNVEECLLVTSWAELCLVDFRKECESGQRSEGSD